MKTSRLYLPALLLVLLWSSGCGDFKTPTEADALPPPGVNLEGAWTGTIGYPQSSDPRRAACGSEPIEATFSQAGSRVSARIETACEGALELGGTLTGNTLTGTLTGGFPGDNFGGTFQSVVSASRISLAVGQTRKDEVLVVAQIELNR
ncbi:MAG: hypothetical protein ACRD3M_19100 [Thermoanaerobaculia bacterium]